MSSLRSIKNKIKSVKSTKKITKAMKLVAASKLRKAREAVEAARPYAQNLDGLLQDVRQWGETVLHPLVNDTGKADKVLLILITTDRGLCGAFNSHLIKKTKNAIHKLQSAGRDVSVYCIGDKGFDGIATSHRDLIVGNHAGLMRKKKVEYEDVVPIASDIISMFYNKKFDVAAVLNNRFVSTVSQIPAVKQLIPLGPSKPVAESLGYDLGESKEEAAQHSRAIEFKAGESLIVDQLISLNVATQLYSAILENIVGEHASRMAAMDGATRNADVMINKLTVFYNSTRQAGITRELIEIISGAEAV